MSTSAANTAAAAIQTDLNQLATDIATLRSLGDAAHQAAKAGGANPANEVLPHYSRDLLYSEIMRVMNGAGLHDLLDFIASRSSPYEFEQASKITNYGAFWTTRNTNAPIKNWI